MKKNFLTFSKILTTLAFIGVTALGVAQPSFAAVSPGAGGPGGVGPGVGSGGGTNNATGGTGNVAGSGGISNTNAQALCTGSGGTWNGTGCDNNDGSSVTGTIKNIVNLLLFLLGAIAVVMVIVGGVRYVTSSGDPSSVKGAKDTILYAIIGLVVAFSAYAIVNFVLSKL